MAPRPLPPRLRLAAAPFVVGAAALALALTSTACDGCGDDPSAVEPSEGAAEATAEGTAPAGAAAATPTDLSGRGEVPLAATGAPESVLGVIGIPSFRHALDTVEAGAAAVAPGVMPPGMASTTIEMAKSLLGLTTLDWLDRDKPVRVILLDPKAHPSLVVAVLPVVAGQDAAASVPGEIRDAAAGEGRLVAWKAAGSEYFLDAVGDGHVALSMAPGAFPAVSAYASGQLLGWSPTMALGTHAMMPHVRKAFGQEISDAKATLVQMQQEIARLEGDDASAASAPMVMDFLFGVVESTASIRGGLSFDREAGMLQSTWRFVGDPGTGFEAIAKAASVDDPAMGDVVPPGSWLAGVVKMDLRGVKVFADLQTMSADMLADMMGLEPAQKQAARKAMLALWESLSGDYAFAFHSDGTFPLGATAAWSLGDESRALASIDALTSVFLGWFKGLLAELPGEAATKLDTTGIGTFKDLAAAWNLVGGAMGATFEVLDEGGASGLRLKMDWKTLGKVAEFEEDPIGEVIMGVLGDELEVAMAASKGVLYITFGPTAFDRVKALAKGERPGGDPRLDAATKGKAGAMLVLPGEGVRAFSGLPGMDDLAEVAAVLPKDGAMLVTMDSPDGKSFDVELDVHAALIRAVVGLIMQAL